MSHPRTDVLTAFETALAALPSHPKVLAAFPVPEDVERALIVEPHEETVDSAAHSATTHTVRRLRVHVICVAKTQADRDQLALEVEDAAPYPTVGVGAGYAGSDFAKDHRSADLLYSIRLNFDVFYERTTP